MNDIVTTPANCTKDSIDKILWYFNNQYLSVAEFDDDPNRCQFYCGITNDIKQNLSRHNISGYVACCQCASFDIARKVEEELGKAGFDIGDLNRGGNGGVEDSVYVYMVKKENGFKK